MHRLCWGPVEGLLPSWIVVLHSEPDWEILSAETLNAVEGFLTAWASLAGASVSTKLVRGSSRTVQLLDEQRAGASRLAGVVCSIIDKDGSGSVDSSELAELGRQLVAARGEHKVPDCLSPVLSCPWTDPVSCLQASTC